MTPEDKRRVHELAGEGLSARAIARLVGCSHPTVKKVLAAPAPAPVHAPHTELPEHMRPPEPPPSTIAIDAPAIDSVRDMLHFAREQVALAHAQGNVDLAQRHTRNVAALASTLARLERTAAAESDEVWRATRHEIDEIQDSLRERIAAILSRPLLCAECSCALSVSWGTGGESHADPNANAKAR